MEEEDRFFAGAGSGRYGEMAKRPLTPAVNGVGMRIKKSSTAKIPSDHTSAAAPKAAPASISGAAYGAVPTTGCGGASSDPLGSR